MKIYNLLRLDSIFNFIIKQDEPTRFFFLKILNIYTIKIKNIQKSRITPLMLWFIFEVYNFISKTSLWFDFNNKSYLF